MMKKMKWIETQAEIIGYRFGYYTLVINHEKIMIPEEVFHKYCSYSQDLLEDGRLKIGKSIEVIIKEGRGGYRVYPNHRYYYKQTRYPRHSACNFFEVNPFRDSQTEFISDPEPNEIARHLCGFINSGKEASILLGLEDFGQDIVGVKDWQGKSLSEVQVKGKELLCDVMRNIHNGETIMGMLESELLEVTPDKYVGRIKIPVMEEVTLFNQSEVYIRVGGETQQLFGEDLLVFFKSKIKN